MKVHELIAELQQVDGNLELVLHEWDHKKTESLFRRLTIACHPCDPNHDMFILTAVSGFHKPTFKEGSE